MAYDEELAHRVRELLADERGITEVAMFGGLAFLVGGNMAVAVSSRGGLMVRVGAEAAEDALSRPHVEEIRMRGRPMTGWVFVRADGLDDRRALAPWVRAGFAFASTLPGKG
jgi:hypothetical protein